MNYGNGINEQGIAGICCFISFIDGHDCQMDVICQQLKIVFSSGLLESAQKCVDIGVFFMLAIG